MRSIAGDTGALKTSWHISRLIQIPMQTSERLKTLYDEALSYPGVLGIVIGTRPDCITSDMLDYLAEMSRDYFVMVEYGIESDQ